MSGILPDTPSAQSGWYDATMKILRRFFSVLFCLFALSPIALAETAPAPAAPASLETAANQTLAITLIGRGVQIYMCTAVPGVASKFEWVLKGPEADLFDADGRKVGRHFAGPTWE